MTSGGKGKAGYCSQKKKKIIGNWLLLLSTKGGASRSFQRGWRTATWKERRKSGPGIDDRPTGGLGEKKKSSSERRCIGT